MADMKTLRTSTGDTYAYVAHSATEGKPTLLFCHGFPDTHETWLEQIRHFTKQGYGAVAPDMLGYGGTDKPTDPEMYSYKRIADSVVSIMDHEGLNKVILVGHDCPWLGTFVVRIAEKRVKRGSVAIGRIYCFHPERILGLIFTNVPFNAPAEFNLEQANALTKQMLGYPTLGYWDIMGSRLFINHEALIMEKFESFKSLMFPEDPMLWKENLCAIDGLKTWLEQDKRGNLAPWFKGERDEAFTNRMKRDGFEAPTCWYKAVVHNVGWKDEKDLPRSLFQLKLPVLMIGATKDCVLPAVVAGMAMQMCATDLTVKTVDGGHWTLMENGDKWTEFVENWLSQNSSKF